MICPVCVGLKTKLIEGSPLFGAEGKKIRVGDQSWFEVPCPACKGTGQIPDVPKEANGK